MNKMIHHSVLEIWPENTVQEILWITQTNKKLFRYYMHLINKKADSNITDTLLLYTVVTKPTYWVNCLHMFYQNTIKYMYRYRKYKAIPRTFFNFAVFWFFFYHMSASDTNQNNTETLTICKINYPEEK